MRGGQNQGHLTRNVQDFAMETQHLPSEVATATAPGRNGAIAREYSMRS